MEDKTVKKSQRINCVNRTEDVFNSQKNPRWYSGDSFDIKDENYFLINFTFSTFPLSSTEMM